MMAPRSRNGNCYVVSVVFAVGLFLAVGCSGGSGSGSGSSGAPLISLSQASLEFGNQVIGQNAERELTVSNTGSADLAIQQLGATETLAAPFSLFVDTCSNTTLRPNASCRVVVRFTPGIQGDFSDSFDINSNGGNQVIAVSGNGRGLRVKINDVFTSEYPEIRLIVSVTDGNSNAVENLLDDNFRLFESSFQKNITVGNAEESRPVSVVMNIDNSGSILPVIADVLNAAKSFLNVLNEPTDEAGVIKFASEVFVAIPITPLQGNLDEISAAIDAAYPFPTRGTKFYDSVYEAVTLLSAQIASNRRAAVIVSDGDDEITPSTQTLDATIQHAQNSGVSLYTIGLGSQLQTAVMQRMADETGGLYLPSPTQADVEGAYQAISVVFSNQYEITFTTDREDSSTNSLRVEVEADVGGVLLKGDDTVLVTY
jgi:VWFA-related protein